MFIDEDAKCNVVLIEAQIGEWMDCVGEDALRNTRKILLDV
jgi:hypothetical protein